MLETMAISITDVSTTAAHRCYLAIEGQDWLGRISIFSESPEFVRLDGETGEVQDQRGWTPHNLTTEQTIVLLQTVIDHLRNA